MGHTLQDSFCIKLVRLFKVGHSLHLEKTHFNVKQLAKWSQIRQASLLVRETELST